MAANKGGWLARIFQGVFAQTSPSAPPANTWTLDNSSPGTVLSQAMNNVGETTVMGLDTVWACVRLIAESIAAVPLNLYQRTPDGNLLALEHPLYGILKEQPNTETTAVVFWEAVLVAMLLRGNAYIEKKSFQGQVRSLVFLDNRSLTIQKDATGKKTYTYQDSGASRRNIPANNIWHIPGFTLDGKEGVSVVTYGASVFGTAIAAERQAAATFTNGGVQNLYYSADAFLTEKQRLGFKQNVKGSIERGETPVLEGGIKVQALNIDPADAQLLESRAHSVEAICRLFRVPPGMVGHNNKGGSSLGSGAESEQNMINFAVHTLSPWMRRIEQSASVNLLPALERKEYFAQFAIKELTRGDSGARSSYLNAMVNNGIMTRDEARAEEGLPRMGGNAAVLTVQSAMVPIEDISNILAKDEGTA